MGQYDRPRVLGFEPVEGVLVVFSSNHFRSPDGRHTHFPSGEQL